MGCGDSISAGDSSDSTTKYDVAPCKCAAIGRRWLDELILAGKPTISTVYYEYGFDPSPSDTEAQSMLIYKPDGSFYYDSNRSKNRFYAQERARENYFRGYIIACYNELTTAEMKAESDKLGLPDEAIGNLMLLTAEARCAGF